MSVHAPPTAAPALIARSEDPRPRDEGAAEPPTTDGLHIDHVSRTHRARTGDVVALDDVSIALPGGGFLAVVGPSGCGKSTLLRMLAGLDMPDEGELRFDVQTPQQLCRDHRIGVAFQEAGLMPWRSVVRNIALPFQVAGEKPQPGRLEELVELVGLEGFEHSRPHQLSGGMRQRVAIARALALQPDLLLLDEPFGALDAITRQQLNIALRRITTSLRTTTVLITHSVSEAVFLADQVVVLSPRPGRVSASIPVVLPADRDVDLLSATEFHRLCGEVNRALVHGAGQ
jgi:NitT/TauT family transport system ATP-binding protein